MNIEKRKRKKKKQKIKERQDKNLDSETGLVDKGKENKKKKFLENVRAKVPKENTNANCSIE